MDDDVGRVDAVRKAWGRRKKAKHRRAHSWRLLAAWKLNEKSFRFGKGNNEGFPSSVPHAVAAFTSVPGLAGDK